MSGALLAASEALKRHVFGVDRGVGGLEARGIVLATVQRIIRRRG